MGKVVWKGQQVAGQAEARRRQAKEWRMLDEIGRYQLIERGRVAGPQGGVDLGVEPRNQRGVLRIGFVGRAEGREGEQRGRPRGGQTGDDDQRHGEEEQQWAAHCRTSAIIA